MRPRQSTSLQNKQKSVGRVWKGPMDLIWTTTTNTNYASRSLSLKAPSAGGRGEAASAAAAVGASGTAWVGGLKAFQGLEGQWNGLSVTASEEADGLEAVVSSSEDSSLVNVGLWDGEAGEGTLIKKCLRGDQPGGRRMLNCLREYGGKYKDKSTNTDIQISAFLVIAAHFHLMSKYVKERK